MLAARMRTGSVVTSILADAGMVSRHKEGTHVYYRIADEGVFDLCEQVCGSLQSQLPTLAASSAAPP
jgi:ArsR family transcriptional regulator